MEVDRQPTTDRCRATERRRNYENDPLKSSVTGNDWNGRSSGDKKPSRTRSSSIRRYEAYRDLIMDESNSVGESTRSSSVILPLSKLNVKQLYGKEIFKHKDYLDSPELKSIARAEKLKDSIESPTTSFSQIQKSFKLMRKVPTDEISEISGERYQSMDNSTMSQEERQDVVTKDLPSSEKSDNNRSTIPRESKNEKQTIGWTDTSGGSTQYTTPQSMATVRSNSRSRYLRQENVTLETQGSAVNDYKDRNVPPNGPDVITKENGKIDSPKDSGKTSRFSSRNSHREDRQYLLRKDHRFRKETNNQDSRASSTKDYVDRRILSAESDVLPRRRKRTVSSNNSDVMKTVSPRTSNVGNTIDRTILSNGPNEILKQNGRILSPSDLGLTSRASSRTSREKKIEERHNQSREDQPSKKETINPTKWDNSKRDYSDRNIPPNGSDVILKQHEKTTSSYGSGLTSSVSLRSSTGEIKKDRKYLSENNQKREAKRMDSMDSSKEYIARRHLPDATDVILRNTSMKNGESRITENLYYSNNVKKNVGHGKEETTPVTKSVKDLQEDNDQSIVTKEGDATVSEMGPSSGYTLLKDIESKVLDHQIATVDSKSLGHKDVIQDNRPRPNFDYDLTKEVDATVSETGLSSGSALRADNESKTLDHQIATADRKSLDHKDIIQDERPRPNVDYDLHKDSDIKACEKKLEHEEVIQNDESSSIVSQSVKIESLSNTKCAESGPKNVHDETVTHSTHMLSNKIQGGEKMAPSNCYSQEVQHDEISPEKRDVEGTEKYPESPTRRKTKKKKKKKKEKRDTKERKPEGESKERIDHSVKASSHKSQCKTSDQQDIISDLKQTKGYSEQKMTSTASDIDIMKQEHSTDSSKEVQEAQDNLMYLSENSCPEHMEYLNYSNKRAYSTVEQTAALSGPEFASGNAREEYDKKNSHSFTPEVSVCLSKSADSPLPSTNINLSSDEIVQGEVCEAKGDNLNRGKEEERSQQNQIQKESDRIENKDIKADNACGSEEKNVCDTIDHASDVVQSSPRESNKDEGSSSRDTSQADFWAKCSIIAASAIIKTNCDHKEELAQKVSETVLLNCTIDDDEQWISRLDDKLQSMSAQVALSIMLHKGGTRELASLTSLAVINGGGDLAVQQFGFIKDDAEKTTNGSQFVDTSKSADKSEIVVETVCESKGDSESLDEILGITIENDSSLTEMKKSILDEESSEDEDDVPSELGDVVPDLYTIARKSSNHQSHNVSNATGSVCSVDTTRVCNRTNSSENDDSCLKVNGKCDTRQKETIDSTDIVIKNAVACINYGNNTEQMVNSKNDNEEDTADINESLAYKIRRIQRRAAEKQKKKTNERVFPQSKIQRSAHHPEPIVWSASEQSFVGRGHESLLLKTEREQKLNAFAEDMISNKSRERVKQMPSHVGSRRDNFNPPPFVQLQISFDNTKREEQTSLPNEGLANSDTAEHIPTKLEQSNSDGLENQTTDGVLGNPNAQRQDENNSECFENVEIFLDDYDGYHIKVGKKEAKKLNLSPESKMEIPSTIDLPNNVEIQVPEEILADDIQVSSGKGPCSGCHGERRFPFKKSLRKVFSKRKK